MLDHHPKDPYKVDSVFEAAKWILKGTNTATAIKKAVAPTPGIITNSAANTAARAQAPIKSETLDATSNAMINMLAYMEECMAALLNARNNRQSQACTPHTLGNGCHFCGEVGHTMVRGNCQVLEAFIQKGKVQHDVKGKVVLLSGTMISNYAGKHLS